MLTRIRGTLQSVSDEAATLLVDPFEIEVLISEHTRRTIQTKLGEPISFHTIFYIEGGAMVSRLGPAGGRLSLGHRPRVLRHLLLGRRRRRAEGAAGDGPAGPRDRPHDRRAGRQTALDVPGIGEATAERIVAKLRRKVGKFALIVSGQPGEGTASAESNGAPESAEPDVIRDTYAALLSVGHTESQAREAIDRVLSAKKKFKSVADMIEAIYLQSR